MCKELRPQKMECLKKANALYIFNNSKESKSDEDGKIQRVFFKRRTVASPEGLLIERCMTPMFLIIAVIVRDRTGGPTTIISAAINLQIALQSNLIKQTIVICI